MKDPAEWLKRIEEELRRLQPKFSHSNTRDAIRAIRTAILIVQEEMKE